MDTPSEAEKEELLEQVYERAYAYEQGYGCCPQCVLAAVGDVLGVENDEVFKAAHALAGGGGLTVSGTCGALIGAILAVGGEHGRDRANFGNGPYMESYRLGKRVIDAFAEEFGGPLCPDVQTKMMGRPFNMWDAKDFQAFEAAGGHKDKCTHVAGVAARIAAEVLLEG
jgi:hypothetical protein